MAAHYITNYNASLQDNNKVHNKRVEKKWA
jgi:hypothetical protein